MYGDLRSMPIVCPLHFFWAWVSQWNLEKRLSQSDWPVSNISGSLSPHNKPWDYRQAPPDDFHTAVVIWTRVLAPVQQVPYPLGNPFSRIFSVTHGLSLLLHLFLGVLGLDLLRMTLKVTFFPMSYILCMSKPLIGAYCLKLIRLLCIYCFNIFLLFWFSPGINLIIYKLRWSHLFAYSPQLLWSCLIVSLTALFYNGGRKPS